MMVFSNLPSSVLQLLAIFLSIIIEALPFVLLGAVLSGLIEVFVTPDLVSRVLPRHKVLRVVFGTFLGLVFPACECGIIPVVNRFLEKKVPSYTAIPFMATAPVINPIVLFATYSAFGHSIKLVLLRFFGASLVALVLGLFLGFVWQEDIRQLEPAQILSHDHWEEGGRKGIWQKIFASLTHAIDDFFDVGRYLVFGAFLAAALQIYVPTRWVMAVTHVPWLAIILLMVLAFILSLCSEADAFIGASLLSSFGLAPVLAFLLLGPMVDIKNLLLMTKVFKPAFIVRFIGLAAVVIFCYCLVIGGGVG